MNRCFFVNLSTFSLRKVINELEHFHICFCSLESSWKCLKNILLNGYDTIIKRRKTRFLFFFKKHNYLMVKMQHVSTWTRQSEMDNGIGERLVVLLRFSRSFSEDSSSPSHRTSTKINDSSFIISTFIFRSSGREILSINHSMDFD